MTLFQNQFYHILLFSRESLATHVLPPTQHSGSPSTLSCRSKCDAYISAQPDDGARESRLGVFDKDLDIGAVDDFGNFVLNESPLGALSLG